MYGILLREYTYLTILDYAPDVKRRQHARCVGGCLSDNRTRRPINA